MAIRHSLFLLSASLLFLSTKAADEGICHPPRIFSPLIPIDRAIVKPSEPVVGEKKGLILLVDFKDTKFTVPSPREWIDSIANRKNYSSGRYCGSVSDYFLAQSNGQLSLTFDVVGPFTMPERLAYYGEKTALRPDAHAGLMIATACQMAAETVDFSAYDWNNDGEAEMVFVVYAGHGEHVSRNTDLIWPKQSTLTLSDYGKPLDVDGIRIDTFACSCELNGDSGSEPSGIGAICHEFSHCFGLPDLYDKYGIGFGMGSWSLMDTGMYNDDGYRPAGFTAYERWYSGWLEPIELKEAVSVRGMKPLSEGGEAYVIYNDAHRDEFFILENRQKTGWDASLEGSGLLITHVDYNASEWRFNSVNSDDRHPRYVAVPADGKRNAETCGGDAYPFGNNNTLTDTSFPPARLYNENTDGRKLLGKPITGIRQNADGTIDFDFMAGAGSAAITTELPEVFDVYSPQGVLLRSGCSREAINDIATSGIVIIKAPGIPAIKTVIRK